MNRGPKLQEQYAKGRDVVNYVVYDSKSGLGDDEVLQHKTLGVSETAHVTLHPDGSVNFRTKRTKVYLEDAIRTTMAGYEPPPSDRVLAFIARVRDEIQRSD